MKTNREPSDSTLWTTAAGLPPLPQKMSPISARKKLRGHQLLFCSKQVWRNMPENECARTHSGAHANRRGDLGQGVMVSRPQDVNECERQHSSAHLRHQLGNVPARNTAQTTETKRGAPRRHTRTIPHPSGGTSDSLYAHPIASTPPTRATAKKTGTIPPQPDVVVATSTATAGPIQGTKTCASHLPNKN